MTRCASMRSQESRGGRRLRRVVDSEPESESAEKLHQAEGCCGRCASEGTMSRTPTNGKPRLSGQALAGLLLALPPLTVVTGPLALYFGYRGLHAVNASDGRLLGRRLAILGMALGAVGTVVLVAGSVALLLLKMRSVSERVECENNLRVIGVAVVQYHENNSQVFPPAVVPPAGERPEQRPSWLAAVLPYLDAGSGGSAKWQGLAGRLDLSKPWDDSANSAALTTYVPYFQCRGDPAFDPRGRPGVTNYVGLSGVGAEAAALPKARRLAVAGAVGVS